MKLQKEFKTSRNRSLELHPGFRKQLHLAIRRVMWIHLRDENVSYQILNLGTVKAQRQAVNSICQGSIKIAMICLHDVTSEDSEALCPSFIDAGNFQLLKGRC